MKSNGIFLVLLIALIGSSISINAQTAAEALRYSKTNFGGTARTMGVGGAFGALGADFGGLSTNPAGLAYYRSSQLSLSPVFLTGSNDASYFGEIHNDVSTGIGINNVGLVLAGNRGKKEPKGWVSSAFAIGYNRLNNFTSDRYISGFNEENSITTRYAQLANGTNAASLQGTASDAFESYLIDPVGDIEAAQYNGRAENGGVRQEEISRVTGNQSELTIDYAGNYEERLYLGGSLNIPFITYESDITFRETDSEGNFSDYDSVTENQQLLTQGVGINGRFGFIYKLNENLRMGGAFHSPTYYSMSDEYSTQLASEAVGANGIIEDFTIDSNPGSFEYKLTTPYKLVGSLAYIVPKFGFISVDYEFQDYSLSRFDFETSDANAKALEGQVNREIKDNFKAASTIRIGAEYALDAFRLRGGYSLQGQPTKEAVQSATQSITAGLGFVTDQYTFDFAFVNTQRDYDYQLYQLSSGSQAANVDERISQLVLSLGYRF